ncbi:MAG: PQQ-dependent sugar dehydrogenase [Planctomycetota bacterium]
MRFCFYVFLLSFILEPNFLAGQIQQGSITIKLDSVVEWNPELDSSSADFELTPTNWCPLNDGTGRYLVPTLAGTIRVVIKLGEQFVLIPNPLLTSNQVGFQLQTETGMTALAVHPNFAGDPNQFGYGKIYTTTSENAAVNGGLSDPDVDFFYMFEVHQEVIREWDLSDIVGDTTVNSLPGLSIADSRELLRIDQPGPFHNLYDMGFNPTAQKGTDEYGQLYLCLGDGGSSGSNASNYQTQIQEPQDLGRIYGKVLRINPDPAAHSLVRTVTNSTAPNAGQPTYSISPTNPFSNDDFNEDRNANTLAEIYAYGLRSPYRMNFDRLNGDLYYGDVGEISREEITKIGIAGNGGWGRFEANQVTNGGVSLAGPSPHTPPVFEYTSAEGRTVVGGIVYRGSRIPELYGQMVFADFGPFLPSARLFYGSVDPEDPEYGNIYEFQMDSKGELFPIDTTGDTIADDIGLLPDRIFSIEEDTDGELYLIAGQDPRGQAPSVPGAYIVRVEAPFLLGDVNRDGSVDLLDVGPFVNSLVSAIYQAEADINGDGLINLLDVQPFVELLNG